MGDTAAIKAAKKALKANDKMKIKELAKAVIAKLSDETLTVKDVKKLIQNSKKFAVEGKFVTLSKKRDSISMTPGANVKKQKVDVIPEDEGQVSQWRKENKIVLMHSVDGADGETVTKQLNMDPSLHPFTSFDSKRCKDSISPELINQCVKGNGFERPSPIQSQSWPILTNKKGGRFRDMVGIAETGSGKTLAFALPALSSLSSGARKHRLPRMLVLAPTRELAMQSDEVLKEFGAVAGLKSLVIYGGVPKWEQKESLKRGVDCVVATPGRIKDLINERACDLSSVEYLVLDEADRMLVSFTNMKVIIELFNQHSLQDMGFEEDVRYIIKACPGTERRQTAMFSATWPAVIQKIAMDFMADPVRVYVGFDTIGTSGEGVDDTLSANKRVSQHVEVIEDHARDRRLREILDKVHKNRSNRVLVFGLYKKEAERLEYSLKRDGWDCCSIHGNKNQGARTAALASFKDGSCPLMIATDVAARGLDIPNVEFVINFTFPLTIEDYVHRIGRTGRAGKVGKSFTFFQPSDKSHAGELQQVMRQAGQDVPEALMKFGSTIKKKEHKLYGNFGPKDGVSKKAVKIKFDY